MKLSNDKNYMLHHTLYNVAYSIITNSILQGFMLENGLKEEKVLLYLAVVQAIQIFIMLGFSHIVDKLKKTMSIYAYSILLQTTMFGAVIFICLYSDLSQTLKTVILFSAGILTNIYQAIYNILSLKTPYYYLDMNKIGNIQGKTGALCSLVGACISGLIVFFTSKFDYNKTMLVFFSIGTFFIIISFLIIKQIRSHPPVSSVKTTNTKKINIFKYKPFYILILPNLLRGFNSGIFVTTMTIGFSLGITQKSSSATLALILQSSAILGNIIFSKTSAPRKNVIITLFGSLGLVLFMPLMVSGNLTLFYLMHFLSSLCITLIDASVPCAVIEIVDFDVIGQFSSYRMLLHTAGITLSTLVAMKMLDLFGGVGTMIISTSFQLISAISYLLLEKSVYKSRA